MNSTPQPSKALRASIVSAVGEYRSGLKPWFRALSSQTVPKDSYEIIVVDSSHQIDYQTALARFRAETEASGNISYHRANRGGRALALNRALDLAGAELIIFLGDDFVVPPEFVEAHLRFHKAHPDTEAVGLGSAIIVPEFRTPFSVWLEESGQLFGVPFRVDMTEVPEYFFYVGNSSVKRELLNRVGRFNERFAHHSWDDFEFGQRLQAAGMRTQFVPDARADHVHNIELRERERSMRLAGAAAKVYKTIHPENHAYLMTAKSLSLFQWLRVTAARFRLAVAPGEHALIKWWQSRLNAAFADGYRNGA